MTPRRKAVTFSRRHHGGSRSRRIYVRVKVHFDGLYVGAIDWLDAGQGKTQGWFANRQLRERYGEDVCENKTFAEAKRIVKRAILDDIYGTPTGGKP